MKEIIIPEEDLIMEQPVAVSIMKFMAEHGVEQGILGKKMTIEKDGIPMEFHQYQNFKPRKGMEIKFIVQD